MGEIYYLRVLTIEVLPCRVWAWKDEEESGLNWEQWKREREKWKEVRRRGAERKYGKVVRACRRARQRKAQQGVCKYPSSSLADREISVRRRCGENSMRTRPGICNGASLTAYLWLWWHGRLVLSQQGHFRKRWFFARRPYEWPYNRLIVSFFFGFNRCLRHSIEVRRGIQLEKTGLDDLIAYWARALSRWDNPLPLK